ncbi:MAG: hypothetical protein H0T73_14645 [Ardenticatenales bacterium]|nr:hypothetical protein [Ardenticatenales bacterium]
MSDEGTDVVLNRNEISLLIRALTAQMKHIGRTMRRARVSGVEDSDLIPFWEEFDAHLAVKERLELLLSQLEGIEGNPSLPE